MNRFNVAVYIYLEEKDEKAGFVVYFGDNQMNLLDIFKRHAGNAYEFHTYAILFGEAKRKYKLNVILISG